MLAKFKYAMTRENIKLKLGTNC